VVFVDGFPRQSTPDPWVYLGGETGLCPSATEPISFQPERAEEAGTCARGGFHEFADGVPAECHRRGRRGRTHPPTEVVSPNTKAEYRLTYRR